MKKTWLEINLDVPAPGIDLVCNELAELGCEGVTVEDRPLDTFVVPDPDENIPEYFRVKTYFPHTEAINELSARITEGLAWLAPLVPGLLPLNLEWHCLKDEDWAEGWKQHFSATAIGKRLIVKPSWEELPSTDGKVIVNIDPGMAFGTGTHGTTLLCLESLAALYAEPPYPARVLDVGTGSGILAIAAAALGAQRVLACDIEPESCRIAAENAARNGVAHLVEVTEAPLESLEGGFDVVVANILAEENIRLGVELTKRLAPGGILLLSGILTEKESLVTRAFADFGLSGPEVWHSAEWVCLRYRNEA